MRTERYEYKHRPGYGSADHMAAELITRAARQLGFNTGNAIAQHVGMASHSVPMGKPLVYRARGNNARRRMERAMRAAKQEVNPSCRDTCIEVVLVRRSETVIDQGENWRTVKHTREEWCGGQWVLKDTDIVSEEYFNGCWQAVA